VDGSDFFTEEISAALAAGEAELAVHSLKDMSAPHFFRHNAFAVLDRDDVRDVAVFHPGVDQKLANGSTLTMGTCSPRREDMAMAFLQKGLPQKEFLPKIQVVPIRGNVENRLRQVAEGKLDGTILATAGLNRLLRDPASAPLVRSLLQPLRIMVLPLFECTPAPCQGAIVVEAHPQHAAMCALLKEINVDVHFRHASAEKKRAWTYGTGCLQRFGVASIHASGKTYLYASGIDQQGVAFTHWEGLPELHIKENELFTSTDYMSSFFRYAETGSPETLHTPVVFVSNHKVLQYGTMANVIKDRRVWVSGSRTWKELAKKGIWVEGSADALGMEQLIPVWKMPLIGIRPDMVTILTHQQAAERWQTKGYKALAVYALRENNLEDIDLKNRRYFFWTSAAQYESLRNALRADAIHMCTSGETLNQLREKGLDPIVFPTIQSFEWWRNNLTERISIS
jgi:hydroxymethylbilane synthase